MVLVGVCVCASAFAQGGSAARERSYVLVIDGKIPTETGYYQWNRDEPLRVYARSHGGSYIAFEENGTLRRVDSPAAVKTIQDLYGPMIPLAAEQERLAALMKPLSEKQAALAKKMAVAVGPENVGRVGQEQGEIGRQQGEIGQQQGRVGQLQGQAGTALAAGFLKIFEGCAGAGSCLVVQ